ncbi:MAG: NdvB, partial [Planctomycetaceae bacterium]|nr:NdvB [Planctomycetaceae bacterium]
MDIETRAPKLRRGSRANFAQGTTILRLGREDEALRAEFLSLDQLTRHGHTLANWHQIADRPREDRLLPSLAENAAVLREAYELANVALSEGRTIVPAAEWLLDNFYIIETHVRMARQHLPRGYSLELPQLVGGPADGRPRVYDIAMELISHADGLLDAENLRHFVAAYQTVTPLKLGELWAIPIMLRLALLENLRRIAVRIAWQQQDRDIGALWAGRVLDALEQDPKQVIVVLADLIKSEPVVSNSFVAEYTQRLQGRVGQVPVAVTWLDQWLLEHGQSVERLVHLNSQTQAADQVSMGNSITSLRALGALDWKQFVEEQSYVDRVLRSDPVGVYQKMSFSSRDRYRHAVERVAKRSPRSEIQVARVAIELAQEAQKDHPESAEEYRKSRDFEPDHHIGYYLVDDGRSLLEKSVGYRPSVLDRLQRIGARFRMPLFLGGMLAIWISMLAIVVAKACSQGVIGATWSAAWLIPLLLLAIYGSQFSVSLINWICGLMAPPRPIDQIDFGEEIPIDCRTIVVVPTMLCSPHGLESLLEQLEVRFLANRDRNLYFALLTDFGDADHETQPDDKQLIDLARQGIELLNQKYAGDRKDTFFLFHRPRVYNEQEGVWMGRERKRGKLTDFNALLCGGRTDAFSVIVGNILPLSTVRYVITLDTDTQLPRDTAQKLIGCMAHPLNRPRFDKEKGCVSHGYAVLQPRVAVTIPEGTRSNYSRMFAGDPGIDPYTNQVSNVYQDVFGEGSFIGKGIYDLRAFEAALHGRFPDNCVLSHDLIESCFARSGLVSELELFEGFPSRYLADASRRHRWVRGDWQLLGWLLPRVPHTQGKVPSPLSWLAWWKLFDNLRRSLMQPALLLMLITAWLLAPGAAVFWTVTALSLIFLPVLVGAIPGLVRVPEEMPLQLHLKSKTRDLFKQILQELYVISVLPYEAHWNVDAVIRTLYRMCVSRKRLLEWTTASDAERRLTGNLADHYELMFAQSVTSLGLVAAIILWAPAAMPAAGPFLLLWLAGPAIAWRMSQPIEKRQKKLSPRQRLHLRSIARRTWHYFDTFVTERDHWLAPDNFQEDPNGVIATRTSPTNIGMGLIANLTAWDLGYIPTGQVVERIGRTLSVLEQMDHFRSHLYNWYDTRTLQPIEPRYISSVDSGNLAGLLLVLKAGLEDLGDQPLVRGEMFDGLADTLRIALELSRTHSASNESAPNSSNMRDATQRLERLLAECRASITTLTRAHRLLERMAAAASDLAGSLSVVGDQRIHQWVKAFEAQCRDFDCELLRLAPWIGATHPVPEFHGGSSPETRGRADQVLHLIEKLDHGCTVNDMARRAGEIQSAIEELVSVKPEEPRNGQISPNALIARAGESSDNGREGWVQYAGLFEQAALEASRATQALQLLALRCGNHALMDFRFLYDEDRDLLAIGYNVSDQRMDSSFYDLLASEARVASFVAISQGQLPREHWFALGRMLTTQGGEPTLLSWSGSMFEYLMPILIMPTYEGTLIDLACRGAVNRQIEYGRQQHVPWGVSESCYNVTDANLTYQYRAFGVPGLGLQRGLGEDLVIAPYASIMGAMVAPVEACRNLERMEEAGYLGEYGFYDAIDFTPARSGPTDEPAVCKTYMAH